MVETAHLVHICRWTGLQSHEATRPREFLEVKQACAQIARSPDLLFTTPVSWHSTEARGYVRKNRSALSTTEA